MEFFLTTPWPEKVNMTWNCARQSKFTMKIANEAVLIFALYKLSDFPAAHPGYFWPWVFNENEKHNAILGPFAPLSYQTQMSLEMTLPLLIKGKCSALTKAHGGQSKTENIFLKSNIQFCFAQIFTVKLIRRAVQII